MAIILLFFFENKANPCSKSYIDNKLAKKQKDLISIYQPNILHT